MRFATVAPHDFSRARSALSRPRRTRWPWPRTRQTRASLRRRPRPSKGQVGPRRLRLAVSGTIDCPWSLARGSVRLRSRERAFHHDPYFAATGTRIKGGRDRRGAYQYFRADRTTAPASQRPSSNQISSAGIFPRRPTWRTLDGQSASTLASRARRLDERSSRAAPAHADHLHLPASVNGWHKPAFFQRRRLSGSHWQVSSALPHGGSDWRFGRPNEAMVPGIHGLGRRRPLRRTLTTSRTLDGLVGHSGSRQPRTPRPRRRQWLGPLDGSPRRS